MKAKIKIKNMETTVRERPTEASTLLKTVDISEEIHLVTSYIKGWYYIDELRGWVKVSDVIITEKIEDFEDDDMSNGSNPDNSNKPLIYDSEEIIKAINDDTKNLIRSDKIYFIVDDKQINLQTLLKSLNNSLIDMQDAVNKIAKMPNIPSLPQNVAEGNVLCVAKDTEDEKLKCTWKNANYEKLDDIPKDVLASEW